MTTKTINTFFTNEKKNIEKNDIVLLKNYTSSNNIILHKINNVSNTNGIKDTTDANIVINDYVNIPKKIDKNIICKENKKIENIDEIINVLHTKNNNTKNTSKIQSPTFICLEDSGEMKNIYLILNYKNIPNTNTKELQGLHYLYNHPQNTYILIGFCEISATDISKHQFYFIKRNKKKTLLSDILKPGNIIKYKTESTYKHIVLSNNNSTNIIDTRILLCNKKRINNIEYGDINKDYELTNLSFNNLCIYDLISNNNDIYFLSNNNKNSFDCIKLTDNNKEFKINNTLFSKNSNNYKIIVMEDFIKYFNKNTRKPIFFNINKNKTINKPTTGHLNKNDIIINTNSIYYVLNVTYYKPSYFGISSINQEVKLINLIDKNPITIITRKNFNENNFYNVEIKDIQEYQNNLSKIII